METAHAVSFENNHDETVEQRMDFDIQDGAQFVEGPSEHDGVGDQGSGESTNGNGSENESDSDSNSDSDDESPPTGKNKRRSSTRREPSEEKYSEDCFCSRDVGIHQCNAFERVDTCYKLMGIKYISNHKIVSKNPIGHRECRRDAFPDLENGFKDAFVDSPTC